MSIFPMNTRFKLYLFALRAADNLPESFSHALDIWTHSFLQAKKKKKKASFPSTPNKVRKSVKLLRLIINILNLEVHLEHHFF